MPVGSVLESSVYEFPDIDELRTPVSRFALSYWRSLRGTRLFPSRNDLEFRALASMLHHMMLVKVIDGGADFEFRLVGDAVVRAFPFRLQNRTLSEVAQDDPRFAAVSAPVFTRVIQTRSPQSIRSRTGPEAMVTFAEGEALFLPLGCTDARVDHIAAFGTFIRR